MLCLSWFTLSLSLQEDAELGPDLISRFLERSGDEKMPDQEIVDIVLNFMLAGRDTTACWLTWTFYEISTRPGDS